MAYGQTGRLNTDLHRAGPGVCGRSGNTEENRVVLFTRRPPSVSQMARGARAVELHAGGRWFDSVCAARFFRYETGALSHQFEAESKLRFFILISWRVLIESCLVSTTLPGKVLEGI